jgi:hypothetical protein
MIFATLVMIASSCSVEKRFNRLIRKNPHLLRPDTTIVHDTVEVIVPRVEHDTTFLEKELHDTVYIEKERLKIKLWKVTDSVYVEGACESDTIQVVREVKVPVYYYKDPNRWWHNIPWWVYLLAIAGVLYYLYKKFRKIIFPEN